VRSKQATPQLIPALAALTGHIGEEVKGYGSLSKVPAEAMGNVRNDMYLTSETIRLMDKNKVGNFDADTTASCNCSSSRSTTPHASSRCG
jgi:PiT family inorganic phosphate transporter